MQVVVRGFVQVGVFVERRVHKRDAVAGGVRAAILQLDRVELERSVVNLAQQPLLIVDIGVEALDPDGLEERRHVQTRLEMRGEWRSNLGGDLRRHS